MDFVKRHLASLSDTAKRLLFDDDSAETPSDDPSPTPDSFTNLVLVIGAAGAGSDAISGLLSRHPAVQPPETGGSGFFAHDELWSRGLDWYRSRWSWHTDDHQWALDFADAYTMRDRYPDVPERIHRAAQDTANGFQPKFLYAVRDPFDRIISEFNRHASSHPETRPASQHPHIPLDKHLIDVSRYAAQLEPYRRLFGRDAIRVVTLETLLNRPTEILRELIDWLSLPVDVAFDPPPATGSDDGPLWQHTQTPSPFDLSQTELFESAGARRRRRLLDIPTTNRQFSLTDRQRTTIAEELDTDLARLAEYYDVDTTHWQLD